MKSKVLKIGFGFFLMCLFAACNDSGTGSDDLNISPEDQPILKSQAEESIKTPTTKEAVPVSEPEIPGSEPLEEEAAPIAIN